MFKEFLIKILLRLIDVHAEKGGDEDKIAHWMSDNWGHPGFIAYIKRRDMEFLKGLGGGAGMTERTRSEYIRMLGQRFELLNFASRCRKEYEKSERLRAERASKSKES